MIALEIFNLEPNEEEEEEEEEEDDDDNEPPTQPWNFPFPG